MHCGWLRCHVVWFDMVVWGELEDDLVIRTTQIYSVLHSTTMYYSGTTLYYLEDPTLYKGHCFQQSAIVAHGRCRLYSMSRMMPDHDISI